MVKQINQQVVHTFSFVEKKTHYGFKTVFFNANAVATTIPPTSFNGFLTFSLTVGSIHHSTSPRRNYVSLRHAIDCEEKKA